MFSQFQKKNVSTLWHQIHFMLPCYETPYLELYRFWISGKVVLPTITFIYCYFVTFVMLVYMSWLNLVNKDFSAFYMLVAEAQVCMSLVIFFVCQRGDLFLSQTLLSTGLTKTKQRRIITIYCSKGYFTDRRFILTVDFFGTITN